MTKAEQLARELMSLCDRYSRRDFERADELLRSGELFAIPLATVKAAQDRFASDVQPGASSPSEKKSAGESGDVVSKRSKRKDVSDQVDLDALLSVADVHVREKLLLFATRYLHREILAHGSSIRAFAQTLGLNLPSTLPSRANVLGIFIKCLINESTDICALHLSQAERIEPQESSLRQWSDLIVKRDDQQQGSE